MIQAHDKWWDLLAILHLQVALVQVGPAVGATNHVLFFGALVVALGTLRDGALFQGNGSHICEKEENERNNARLWQKETFAGMKVETTERGYTFVSFRIYSIFRLPPTYLTRTILGLELPSKSARSWTWRSIPRWRKHDVATLSRTRLIEQNNKVVTKGGKFVIEKHGWVAKV